MGWKASRPCRGHEELKAAGLLDTRPAITALGARGLLPEPGDVEEEDEIDEEEASEILRAEFGATIEPETEVSAGDPDSSEEAEARDESEGDPETGDEPEAAEVEEPAQPDGEDGPSEQTLAEVHPIEAGRKTGA